MALELKQSLRLSQQLVMTPQLQQAIKLLQLNRLELAEHITTEMLENPLLEEQPEIAQEEIDEDEKLAKQEKSKTDEKAALDDKEGEVDPEKGKGTDDINWENYLNSEMYRPAGSGNGVAKDYDPDMPSAESMMTRAASLSDHLTWQLKLSRLPQVEHEMAEMIIGNLDEDGYLRSPLEDIAHKLRKTAEEVETILKKIQEFDPLGVGARDLRECLLLQTKSFPGNLILVQMISNHLKELERKAYPLIAKELNISIDEVVATVKLLSRMEPKPGRRFYEENSQYITPDIYVYKVNHEYVIVQNEDGLPKLKISNFYQNLMRGNGQSAATKEYVNEKLRGALWLIRSIHQRQRTIYKVTESIVRKQRDFLDHGIAALRPMVLRDVAEDIGMHESTVSRVTSNKYIHTPQGIFELKYFFNASIKRVDGEDIAAESAKHRIKEIILAEDAKRPYSDQELVELLRQANIDIARRTVAKYREQMGILSSAKRKKYF